jgi:hypothetical protein
MSRGPGFLERKIINMLRYGRRSWAPDADDIAERAYPQERGSYWARHVAVLRAMRSVARKYPDKFVLRGGKGRTALVIMPVKEAPEWDRWHRPRRRGAADQAKQAKRARVTPQWTATIYDLLSAYAQVRARA